MNVRDFFIKLPFLCDADNAERWSKLNEYQFDFELGMEGVFSRNEKDKKNHFNRLETAFGFCSNSNNNKTKYCKKLALIILLNHYQKEHGENHEKELAKLSKSVSAKESIYPEISSVMTVKQALTSTWSG